MAVPGWYPDPAGAPGRFRYWDGHAWSAQTTNDTNTPPPRPPAQGRRRSSGWGWWLVVLVILLAVGVVAWLMFGRGPGPQTGSAPEDTNTFVPTVPVWDESSTPSTPPPSQASMVRCPVTRVTGSTDQGKDGRLHGGGLSVQRIKNWQDQPMYLEWISDFHNQVDEVYPGWISNIGVGALNKVDGFVDPRTSAEQTLQCFATTDYYRGFTGRKDIISQQRDISGYYGWWMQSEIYVSLPELPQVQGDRVDVIVVDLGGDHLGILLSSGTIGDTTRLPLIDAAIASLRAD